MIYTQCHSCNHCGLISLFKFWSFPILTHFSYNSVLCLFTQKMHFIITRSFLVFKFFNFFVDFRWHDRKHTHLCFFFQMVGHCEIFVWTYIMHNYASLHHWELCKRIFMHRNEQKMTNAMRGEPIDFHWADW